MLHRLIAITFNDLSSHSLEDRSVIALYSAVLIVSYWIGKDILIFEDIFCGLIFEQIIFVYFIQTKTVWFAAAACGQDWSI